MSSKLGIHRGRRQPEYCVTWYALGKQPLNDLHGVFINIGTYDTLKEAETDAARIRLEIKDVGGRVRVHLTGHPEGLMGDDFKYAANRKMVGDDMNEFHSQKEHELKEKRTEEARQMKEKLEATRLEEEMADDPTALDSYAQLHVRRRMLEEAVVAHTQNLARERLKLQELREEISERDVSYPTYREEWRDFIQKQIGTNDVFILKEREDDEAPAVDVEQECQRVAERAMEAGAGVAAGASSSSSSSC